MGGIPLYQDGTEQGSDAPSSTKLYLKIGRARFYPLFGDDATGLTPSHDQSLGEAENHDLPSRTALGAEYRSTTAVILSGSQEVTWGEERRAPTSHFGLSATPWHTGASLGRWLGRGLWPSLGYNLSGFSDADFSRGGYTAQGPFLALRLKLDEGTAREGLLWLGLAGPAEGGSE